MSIADLFERSEDDFIAANRGGPDDLWLFIHVPKTAGSSLQSQLSARLRPAYNIHIDYEAPRRSYAEDFGQAVDRFIEAGAGRRCQFASGHIDVEMARRIEAALSPVRLITMMRHPVQRVISEFRYQRTPAHPPHEQFRQRFPRIEDYVRGQGMQNGMFRRLGLEGESAAEAAARLDRDFTFIGTLETYDYSLRLLSRLLGCALRPETVVRRTDDGDDNRVELTPALEQEIVAANALDLALWTHYQTRLLSAQRRARGAQLDEAGREVGGSVAAG
jgi:hypothetical protein